MTRAPGAPASPPAPPDHASVSVPPDRASVSVPPDRVSVPIPISIPRDPTSTPALPDCGGGPRSRDCRSASGSGERGSASVVMVALIGVIVSTTAGALVLAGVVRASHQARLGADLSAIAAALQLRDGGSASTSCAEAARIAIANGASLQSCSVSGRDVTVVVAASSPAWPQPATARARAGPET